MEAAQRIVFRADVDRPGDRRKNGVVDHQITS